MTNLCSDLIRRLAGQTVCTAESCTGGMIGAALTAVSGSSKVYKGGIISYTNEVKHSVLGVPFSLLEKEGAVSAAVAEAMAMGVRKLLSTDYAVSVTGWQAPAAMNTGTRLARYLSAMPMNTRRFQSIIFSPVTVRLFAYKQQRKL